MNPLFWLAPMGFACGLLGVACWCAERNPDGFAARLWDALDLFDF